MAEGKARSMTDQSGRDLYARAGEPLPVVNRQQVECLFALMTTGELRGVVYEDVEPPKSVVLVGMGERGDLEDICDQNGEVVVEGSASANSLGVIADDGRQWTIAAVGITWPKDAGRVA